MTVKLEYSYMECQGQGNTARRIYSTLILLNLAQHHDIIIIKKEKEKKKRVWESEMTRLNSINCNVRSPHPMEKKG